MAAADDALEFDLNHLNSQFNKYQVGTILKNIGGAGYEAAGADWTGAAPAGLEEAVNRLAAAFKLMLARVDSDAGVTGTDYEATYTP